MKQNGDTPQYDLQDIYTDDSGIKYPKNLLRPLNANAILIAGIAIMLIVAAFCGVALAHKFPPAGAIPSAGEAVDYITVDVQFLILDQGRELQNEFYADIKNKAKFSFEGTVVCSVEVADSIRYETSKKLTINAGGSVRGRFDIPYSVRKEYAADPLRPGLVKIEVHVRSAEGRFFR